jgi:hypothetical protein
MSQAARHPQISYNLRQLLDRPAWAEEAEEDGDGMTPPGITAKFLRIGGLSRYF